MGIAQTKISLTARAYTYLMQASCNRDTHVDDLDPGSLLDSILLDAAKPEVLVPPPQPLMQLVQHMHQQILFLWVEGHHIWPCHLQCVQMLSPAGVQLMPTLQFAACSPAEHVGYPMSG